MKEKDFDLAAFKRYIRSYKKYENQNNDSIINDIMYGIGISLDKDQYSNTNGYLKYLQLLKNSINNDIIKLQLDGLINKVNKIDQTLNKIIGK